METKIINSLDEIKTTGRYAKIGFESNWIEIKPLSIIDLKEYTVYGIICGERPTSITTNGYICKTWKTINGVVRALKGYAKENSWAMGHWKE